MADSHTFCTVRGVDHRQGNFTFYVDPTSKYPDAETTQVTLICMQCTPIRKFWDADVPGTCPLTPMMSLFAAGIPHFIIELGILLCPLFEIWKLHLPWRRKLAVAVMFTAGIAVCVSALMTIVHTLALDKKMDKDLTWDGLEDQIWAVCDVNLASLASK